MVDDRFGEVVGEDGKDGEESLPMYLCSSRRRRLVKSGNILASKFRARDNSGGQGVTEQRDDEH
jgi:hypothetical protein